MGIFGASNDVTVTEEVETATNEKSVEEDWGVIMNICDKAGKSSEAARNYLKAIIRRLYNNDPHVGIKAVTLLDACVKNSGKTFHVEVASRDFENDFTKLMTKAPPSVAKKLRESLKRWAETEFKIDGQLNLIPSLYSKLKNSGYDFSLSETPVKKATPLIKDPNVVESQEEEEQILKAIELSLKETGSPRSSSGQTSIYPSVNTSGMASSSSSTPGKELRKVRALYDFEAAEDNELTFSSGEIVFVIDDSDPNWWKGSNQRGEGLFPANFVTADLSVEPEKFLYEKAKKMVQFKETAEVKFLKEELVNIEINEEKIDRLLHLLHEADPTNLEADTDEMLNLEREVNAMGPLIDTELERVDRKHAQLTQLSSDLVEALSLYHMLMREPQLPPVNKAMYGYSLSTTAMALNNTVSQNVHPSLLGPRLHPAHERAPFIHSGSGQVQPPQFPSIQMTNSSHLPSIQGMPSPHTHETPLNQYLDPRIAQNYGITNMAPSTFPQPITVSQTNLQNGTQQEGSPFVSSNTHITQ
ncbi:signal transducing adapter molecule 1 isoform X1 [Anoplophora glabripennis]|nr:signal transducing adapter molecule 1 isoform X1 [Anoplophora glabripennis]